MGEKELHKAMVTTTLFFVKVLLYSERIVKETNDRTLLKNLGVWLGLLTFARNRPVLSRDLEIKTILVEAYTHGRLIAVLPFVQKLLECCRWVSPPLGKGARIGLGWDGCMGSVRLIEDGMQPPALTCRSSSCRCCRSCNLCTGLLQHASLAAWQGDGCYI